MRATTTVHSIELLGDDAGDSVIRRQWTLLADAGLPSARNHASPTNRPHTTLAVANAFDPGVLTSVAPVAMRLPLACRLGAPLVFGGGDRRVLVRLVVPSAELLSIHATVVRLAAPSASGAVFEHLRPGAWTPHITLARRMSSGQIAAALDVLDRDPQPDTIMFSALRLWNGDRRSEQILEGRAC